jgi:hypothetical protein
MHTVFCYYTEPFRSVDSAGRLLLLDLLVTINFGNEMKGT